MALRCLALAGLLVLCSFAAQAQVTRFLVVGDSWAAEQWEDSSHQRVFNNNDLAAVVVSGELTTTSGSTAADWVMPDNLGRIGTALAQYPHIDTVQLTIGGNDFLDTWNTSFSEAQFDELIGWISQDIEFVSTYILNQRPEIEIVVSLYDYPNFEDTRSGLIWTFACGPLWNDLGGPTPLQVNTAAVEVIDAVENLTNASPRISHVRHLGQAQNAYGIPGFPPGTVVAPGDVSLPSPPAAMRTRFLFGGLDCFHFNAATYDVLVENLRTAYVEGRFDSGLDLQFESLQAVYDGSSQTVPVVTIPPDQGLIISYDGALTEPADAGSYNVIVTAPGWRESISAVFEILQAAQTIEFQIAGPVFVDQIEIELVATADSGLPVGFELLSGPATLSDNVLTLTGQTGTVVVVASQSGDANWQASESVERSIEVIERVDALFEDSFEMLP